mmetsp:Transcript_63170/g.175176  ORF Transcript_63170/g.175176 Transcript_63170/m.175176 type:complete len:178 (+) Transcript_63170:57-590(+)
MAAIQVSVKYGKASKDLDFPSAEATIGDLRDAIEKHMSVPKAVQTLICAGRRWQGLAFGDDLQLLDAAGPRGTKEIMGAKAISVMLMAPAGADGGEEVERARAQVDEVRTLLGEPPADPEALRKALLLADDLLTRAATCLDGATLVGEQRERRRELLKQIEALGEEVTTRKAGLSGK